MYAYMYVCIFPNYFIDEQIKLIINNIYKINDKSYATQNNYNHLIYCIVIKSIQILD